MERRTAKLIFVLLLVVFTLPLGLGVIDVSCSWLHRSPQLHLIVPNEYRGLLQIVLDPVNGQQLEINERVNKLGFSSSGVIALTSLEVLHRGQRCLVYFADGEQIPLAIDAPNSTRPRYWILNSTDEDFQGRIFGVGQVEDFVAYLERGEVEIPKIVVIGPDLRAREQSQLDD